MLRVLIVDDVEDLRMLLRDYLQLEGGIEVIGEAKDGLEAVEMAFALMPDVILMDLAMPRMGGIEATRTILAKLPKTRIIAYSGFKGEHLEKDALAAGAECYLEKGIAIERIHAQIVGN